MPGRREITEKTEITEQTEKKQKIFRLFRYFRLFRNLSFLINRPPRLNVELPKMESLIFLSHIFLSGRSSRSFEIELRLRRLAVIGQRAVLADCVRPLEYPILPRRQSSEDFGIGCLRAGEAQRRLHAGQRVR